MKNKLTIYIDMDGVLANFDKAAKENPHIKRPDLHLDFSTFEPIVGAEDAVKKLEDMGHDLFIATTPPWNHPNAWGQKRNWIEKHFPTLKRKMFLTHRKDLLKGDILIDDTIYRGQRDFEGEFMWFGQDGMDWPYIVETIKTITNLQTLIK